MVTNSYVRDTVTGAVVMTANCVVYYVMQNVVAAIEAHTGERLSPAVDRDGKIAFVAADELLPEGPLN